MQDQRCVFTRADGGVSVIVPSPDFNGDWNAHIAELIERGSIAPADTPEVLHVSEIPADRTLRDAWKRGEQGKKCGVDMVKGKEVAHAVRRAKRAEEFAPLDVEATIPAKAAEAEGKRQLIRDKYATVQTSIDACSDPEALVACMKANGLA